MEANRVTKYIATPPLKPRLWMSDGEWYCGLEFGPYMRFVKKPTRQEAWEAFQRKETTMVGGSRKRWLQENTNGTFGMAPSIFY